MGKWRMKNGFFLSFVIPTFNVERYIAKLLKSIKVQKYPLSKLEIIIVDDNSTDKTIEEINLFRKQFLNLKLIVKDLSQPKGAASSTNIGLKNSKGQFICLVDADAILAPNWLKALLPKFKDPQVGMVAGVIKTANPQNLWAAFAGRELEDRYAQVDQQEVDHVSTCNTVYRRELFEKVGMFAEEFYYGYDVDFSFRVKKAGWKILLVKETDCFHFWKESFKELLKQWFNTGFARLKILEKFPDRKVGGKISGWKLMVPVTLTGFFLIFLVLGLFSQFFFYLALVFLILIFLIQVPQTGRILLHDKDFRFFGFPFFLFLRNLIWIWVFLKYSLQKIFLLRSST